MTLCQVKSVHEQKIKGGDRAPKWLLAIPPAYASKLREIILSHQEPDGSWWDYDLYDYEKFYGTAFALMAIELAGQ
jgi:hypothetical protein